MINTILNVFRKKKESIIRDNPVITFLLYNDYNHALFIHNPENIKYSEKRNRAIIKAFPKDIDDSLDDEEIEKQLDQEYTIITNPDLIITVGKGEGLSSYRTVQFVLPENPNMLPKTLREVFEPYILMKKAQKKIDEARNDIDRAYSLKYLQNLGLLNATMTSLSEDLLKEEIEKKNKLKQQNM